MDSIESRTRAMRAFIRERFPDHAEEIIKTGKDFAKHCDDCEQCRDIAALYPGGASDEAVPQLCQYSQDLHHHARRLMGLAGLN